MVKVFTTNSNGKIEFTKDELEKVLNEVWQDGRNSASSSYWWTSPTIRTQLYNDKTVEVTLTNEVTNSLTIE